jgi:hypothetical protein
VNAHESGAKTHEKFHDCARLFSPRTGGRPHRENPLYDCDYLDACTGSCLGPVGIPEDDLSFYAAPRAAWPHARGDALMGSVVTSHHGRRDRRSVRRNSRLRKSE